MAVFSKLVIERIPQDVPMPCYGAEQRPANLTCGTCLHKDGCAAAMGKRLNRVTVDSARFNLIPEALADVMWSEDDEFKQAYDECYRIIFHPSESHQGFDPDSLHKCPDIRSHVESAAAKIGCPLRMFLLTTMWGHKVKNPGARFYCSMLAGEAACRRVKAYRAEVENLYGVFTEKTLDEYTDDATIKTHARKLLDAEVTAGSWIVGYKIKKGGPPEVPFYDMHETQMPDLWLAVEPSYHKFLVEWRAAGSQGTPAQRKQRARVAKLTAELKRRSKQAIAVFKARESIMGEATKRVLEFRSFNTAQFRVQQSLVFTSTFLFWTRLGLAIQHYWCLEYLKGDKHKALRALSSNSVVE